MHIVSTISSLDWHVNITDVFLRCAAAIAWNKLDRFANEIPSPKTNSNPYFRTAETTPCFAVEVNLQRSVTYNVPSQPTFLACIPLPGRINITVNVYMRTALRATVSLTLPLCSSSFFLLAPSEFPLPFLTFSAPAVNRLVSPSFASLIRPSPSYIIPRTGREISTFIHMCEVNVGCRCGRHFIKTTGWRFSFCPAAAFPSSVN